MEKVQAAVDSLKNFSAPNSEETVFNVMLKSGWEAVVKGLHYIIQKCWSNAVLRPCQQLRSCRAGQLPINTVPEQAVLLSG